MGIDDCVFNILTDSLYCVFYYFFYYLYKCIMEFLYLLLFYQMNGFINMCNNTIIISEKMYQMTK